MATPSEPDSGNYWGSQNRIRNRSFGAHSTPTWSLTLCPSNFHRNYAPRGLSGPRKMRLGNGPPSSTCLIVPSTFYTSPLTSCTSFTCEFCGGLLMWWPPLNKSVQQAPLPMSKCNAYSQSKRREFLRLLLCRSGKKMWSAKFWI